MHMQMRLMGTVDSNTFLHRAFVVCRFSKYFLNDCKTIKQKHNNANKGQDKHEYDEKCVRTAHEHKQN
jgi:hypothetical protein